jgi:hypothetical protein
MLSRMLVAVALSTPLCCLAQVEKRSDFKFVTPIASLLGSMKKANVSASLEFSGRCGFAGWPRLRIPPTSDEPPLQVARETFADDPSLTVTREPDGTIRIIQSDVPTDLLSIKIAHLSRSYAYDPAGLVEAILWAPEVARFRNTRGIHIPLGGGAVPGSNIPPDTHAVDSMNDLTVSQVLDRVLKVFPGIWVYQDCLGDDGKTRSVRIQFFSSSSKGFAVEE